MGTGKAGNITEGASARRGPLAAMALPRERPSDTMQGADVRSPLTVTRRRTGGNGAVPRIPSPGYGRGHRTARASPASRGSRASGRRAARTARTQRGTCATRTTWTTRGDTGRHGATRQRNRHQRRTHAQRRVAGSISRGDDHLHQLTCSSRSPPVGRAGAGDLSAGTATLPDPRRQGHRAALGAIGPPSPEYR